MKKTVTRQEFDNAMTMVLSLVNTVAEMPQDQRMGVLAGFARVMLLGAGVRIAEGDNETE